VTAQGFQHFIVVAAAQVRLVQIILIWHSSNSRNS
jgi:hypothetical protein